MSRLVNIDSDEFWQILFDEACVEGNQAIRIENELSKITVDEKEIRIKIIDEFADRMISMMPGHRQDILKIAKQLKNNTQEIDMDIERDI